MQDKFTKIYDKKIWGGGSGKGSTLFYNKNFIFFLEDFIKEKSIKSVIDLGCGDWEFSQYINWNCEYLGIDCVETVVQSNIENYQTDSIKFEHGDIFSDRTILDKQCDLIILKDVLQHWDNLNIIDFINDIISRKKYKYILIINGKGHSEDRNINNRYMYAKLDADNYPLNLWNPKVVLNYRFKQVSLIEKTSARIKYPHQYNV